MPVYRRPVLALVGVAANVCQGISNFSAPASIASMIAAVIVSYTSGCVFIASPLGVEFRVLLINTLEASPARLGRQSVQGLQKRLRFFGGGRNASDGKGDHPKPGRLLPCARQGNALRKL